MSETKIVKFIESLRRQNLSSPIGGCWDNFYRLLSDNFSCTPLPPKPLILAASSEAAFYKLARLKDQLLWALQEDRFDDAMNYLNNLRSDDWEHCPEENWYKSYY